MYDNGDTYHAVSPPPYLVRGNSILHELRTKGTQEFGLCNPSLGYKVGVYLAAHTAQLWHKFNLPLTDPNSIFI